MRSRREVDLVIVNPGTREQVYQSLGDDLAAIEPPVWAGMIATYARLKGRSVVILDMNAEDISPDEAAARVAEADPLLTAVVVYGHQPSASTQNMPAAGAICAALREGAEAPTLLVGGHVAALPERTLREEDADYVSGGEGLATIVELLDALDGGRPEDIRNVAGLWYVEDGVVRTNPPAPLLQDLDGEMPHVAWDLLPMDAYRAHNWHCFADLQRQPYAAVYTTLGCPYKCSFCCIQAPFKEGERLLGYKESANSYRRWSPEVVVDQIDHLVSEYGVRNIKVADEMFVLNRRHVTGICELLIERGYDLNIWAYARVDSVQDDMLDMLRAAGFTWLCFGIEAGSERVRSDVDKGFDEDAARKTLRAVKDAGIHVMGNYIFGLPEDDHDTMQATLDMALDLNTEFANFYCAMAYPGSPLYTEAVASGWRLPDSWSGYSQHSYDTLPLPTKHLSGADVLRFRDAAFTTYYTNPNYLAMIRETFGAATERHVVDMTSGALDRKHT